MSLIEDIARKLNLDNTQLRIVPVMASVTELDEPSVEDLALCDAVVAKKTAAGPLDSLGKPRIMRVSAWIAHGGPANRNGDAFLEEDLKETVEQGLFQAPYFGMMDFNHGFDAHGVWYKAAYKYDDKAGQWGVLAEGTMFAWRYNELADKMLAEQARAGHVEVSMACIPASIDMREASNGRTEAVLRKPTFLAVSLLDVSGADPYAKALVSENPESSEEERVGELAKAMIKIAGNSECIWELNLSDIISASAPKTIETQEVPMDYEKLLADIVEAMGDKVAGLEDMVSRALEADRLAADLDTMTAKVTEVETALAAEKATAEERGVQIEALNVELANLRTELEVVRAELKVFNDGVAAAAAAELRAARLAALPAAYRTALEQRDGESKERVINKLVEMAQDEFEDHVAVLASSVVSEEGYTARSRREGALPGGSGQGGKYRIDQL